MHLSSKYIVAKNQLCKAEVHCFPLNGNWHALDVRKMRVSDISPQEAEIMALHNEKINIINNSDDEYSQALERLKEKQLVRYTSEQSLLIRKEPVPGISTLELNITQDCNLRCKYCCVEHGSFGAKRAKMSPEIIIKAIDVLINESKDKEIINLRFFGGEPLLNFPIIKIAVQYAQAESKRHGKTANFQIITNGTLFNEEVISFIKENDIHVQVSLDGDKGTHDKMRMFPDGEGSYNMITNWLPQLTKNYKKNVRLWATLTSDTSDFVASLKHLRQWDAGDFRVRHAGDVGSFKFTDGSYEQLKNSYTKLAHLYIEEAIETDTPDMGVFLPYILALCEGQRRSYWCNAAESMLGVSASGKLYPCSDLAENDEYELGNVWTGIDWQVLNYLRDKIGDVDHIPACQNCWARYLCAGGCIAFSVKINGDPWQPNSLECDLTRHIVELSIWIYSQLLQHKPEAFIKIVPHSDELQKLVV